jgi:DNA-binding MarR family transcriptional regulator
VLSTTAGTLVVMESASANRISDEQLAAWRAFLRAHSTMLRRITADLEGAEMPPLSWYDVLAALKDAPENALRQVELAEQVLLSNSGLSRLIDRIERDGLVERRSCDTDRRSFFVALTPQGSAMLDRMWPVYARGIADDFLPALGSNPCEVREMLETIGATCDAARAAEAEAAERVGESG